MAVMKDVTYKIRLRIREAKTRNMALGTDVLPKGSYTMGPETNFPGTQVRLRQQYQHGAKFGGALLEFDPYGPCHAKILVPAHGVVSGGFGGHHTRAGLCVR